MHGLCPSRSRVPHTWSGSSVGFSSEQACLICGITVVCHCGFVCLLFPKINISCMEKLWYNSACPGYFIHANFTDFHRMWLVVCALTKVHCIHLHRKLSTEANGRLMRKGSLSACHGIACCIQFVRPALGGLEEVHEMYGCLVSS